MRYLDEDEITAFVDQLDRRQDGFIYYRDLQNALDKAYQDLQHASKSPHGRTSTSPERASEHEEQSTPELTGRNLPWHETSLLCSLLGFSSPSGGMVGNSTGCGEARKQTSPTRIPRAEFVARVRAWGTPSLRRLDDEKKNKNNTSSSACGGEAFRTGVDIVGGGGGGGSDQELHDPYQYLRSMSRWRRVRSYWAVHGPQVAFVAFVVALQAAFSLWIAIKYATKYRHTELFNWGTVVSKACAGALLPTLVFLILSMSRYLSTFLRRSYRISRFINWDLSRRFHIQMAVLVIILSTIHMTGHLAGTFVHASSSSSPITSRGGTVMTTYRDYLAAPASLSGLSALGCLYLTCLLSLPAVRRRHHELFQRTHHLLLYLFVGALIAHGSRELLYPSMLEWFLVGPAVILLVEHALRFAMASRRVPATLTVLDDDVVEVHVSIPAAAARPSWQSMYRAGQYVFLQVPGVSHFQWHPFTVSTCTGRDVWLHIKTDGDWTRRVRALAVDACAGTPVPIEVGISGPFGAPAQRFHDYSHTVVVGAGIGVTPFTSVLADLQAKHNHLAAQDVDVDTPWTTTSTSSALAAPPTLYSPYDSCAEDKEVREKPSRNLSISSSVQGLVAKKRPGVSEDYRRVDFHWIVRDRSHVLWFAGLLNAVSRSQLWRRFFARPYYIDTSLGAGAFSSWSGSPPFARRATTPSASIDINIKTYVTRSDARDLTTHVCHWLLEQHLRTPEHPGSHLTGLLNPTQLGRPDFVRIMTDHYEDMRACQVSRRLRAGGALKTLKVGVFFCGTPMLGEVLSDLCRGLTARGRNEGTKIEYHFHQETF